jgi:hypothetical protein
MPKVSVVILSYDYTRFPGEVIQGVLYQAFADSEVIVVEMALQII